MPNSRRRKFLVKRNLKMQPMISKTENECYSVNKISLKLSNSISDIKTDSRIESCINSNNLKTILTEESSNNQTPNIINVTSDCDICKSENILTACSSTRNISNLEDNDEASDKSCNTNDQTLTKISKSKLIIRRHARKHRTRIREAKSSLFLNDCQNIEKFISVDTDDLLSLSEAFIDTIPYLTVDKKASAPVDDMCRICHGSDTLSQEFGNLISACSCRGTVGRVHVRCLERWLTESGKSRCELCGIMYITRHVHRYGITRALVMWILSRNTKQLMVDTLGIMLMSPLAILAAWLSGRTLTTLISKENHIAPAPWPLASTFVLACMTLVCYYCWIVSAATRHALSWWIWYRSQYEVRLQLNSDCED